MFGANAYHVEIKETTYETTYMRMLDAVPGEDFRPSQVTWC